MKKEIIWFSEHLYKEMFDWQPRVDDFLIYCSRG